MTVPETQTADDQPQKETEANASSPEKSNATNQTTILAESSHAATNISRAPTNQTPAKLTNSQFMLAKRAVAGWLIESINVLGEVEMQFDTPLEVSKMESATIQKALKARILQNPEFFKTPAVSAKADVNVTEISRSAVKL